MGHIPFWFLLLLFLLNLHRCLHKQGCVFVFLALQYRFVVSLLCLWLFQTQNFQDLVRSGSIPLLILLVNKRSAPFTLLFCISYLNFDESFSIFIWLFVDGNLSCMFYFRSQVRWCFLLPTISVFFLMLLGGFDNLLFNAFRWSSKFYLVFVGVVRA